MVFLSGKHTAVPKKDSKFAALLMLYPTERLELLAANAQNDARFEHQKRKSRPRAAEKTKKEKSEKWLV